MPTGLRPEYRRRQPELTPLYETLAVHLASFRDRVQDEYERALPRYVEEELDQYLRCGILAHGFVRARCKDCGKDLLVAFSCKKRGVCPSCNARRMANTAAHLVDHVIPDVPLRQYVLSVPFELRLLLAKNPEALTMVGRVFVEEIFRWQRDRAREGGVGGEARGAAICFPQRFGSSLNLNVHYHVPVVDGVFTRKSPTARAKFHRTPRPKVDDLEAIAERVERRVVRWLRRRALLTDEPHDDTSNAPRNPSPLEACLEGSLGLGELTTLPGAPLVEACESGIAGVPVPRSHHRRGRARGFDVHAAVVVSARDREGRERLLRYCARPPFALERMSRLPDGRVAYALKNPWRSGETHRVMEPVQFIARLAALVPPPRHPLIRFYGCFAPNSSWRASVVPGPPPPASSVPAGDQVATAKPTSSRINWAELLKRIYDVDALACECGGRLRFIALITEPETARAVLRGHGLPTEPPLIVTSRPPCLADFFDAAPPDYFEPPPPDFFDAPPPDW